jgi:hypothetical protein
LQIGRDNGQNRLQIVDIRHRGTGRNGKKNRGRPADSGLHRRRSRIAGSQKLYTGGPFVGTCRRRIIKIPKNSKVQM